MIPYLVLSVALVKLCISGNVQHFVDINVDKNIAMVSTVNRWPSSPNSYSGAPHQDLDPAPIHSFVTTKA